MQSSERHTRTRINITIDLKKLERESRKFLYTGILLGMAVHLIILFFIPYQKAEIEQKTLETIPLTLKNIPPAETEPFEISPPETKQKSYATKQFRHGMPSKDIITTSPSYDETTPSAMTGLGKVVTELDGRNTFGKEKALPGPLSDYKGLKDTIDRRPKGRISVTDEMISISDLDTGQYKSMLILDPSDPLNTKGYVHIPIAVEGITFKPNPLYKDALMCLAESFHNFTGITLKVDHMIWLSSRDLLKYPFIYLSLNGKGIEFTRFEARNFYEYLVSGGFALADIGTKSFEEFYTYIKDTYGDDVQITGVPKKVYKSLIDIQPHGNDLGAYINSTLCIIHSPCYFNYADKWLEYDTVYTKWGINILYYALMQSPKTAMLVDDSSRTIKNSRQWWDYDMQRKYNEKFEVE